MSECPSHFPNPRIDRALKRVFETSLKPLGSLRKHPLLGEHCKWRSQGEKGVFTAESEGQQWPNTKSKGAQLKTHTTKKIQVSPKVFRLLWVGFHDQQHDRILKVEGRNWERIQEKKRGRPENFILLWGVFIKRELRLLHIFVYEEMRFESFTRDVRIVARENTVPLVFRSSSFHSVTELTLWSRGFNWWMSNGHVWAPKDTYM